MVGKVTGKTFFAWFNSRNRAKRMVDSLRSLANGGRAGFDRKPKGDAGGACGGGATRARDSGAG